MLQKFLLLIVVRLYVNRFITDALPSVIKSVNEQANVYSHPRISPQEVPTSAFKSMSILSSELLTANKRPRECRRSPLNHCT